jgi:protein-L-isoaspartate O-methyltransferase
VPPALKAQLADGGRLVMPVGEPHHQQLIKITRLGEGGCERLCHDAEAIPPRRYDAWLWCWSGC